jgi:hypothetical protein
MDLTRWSISVEHELAILIHFVEHKAVGFACIYGILKIFAFTTGPKDEYSTFALFL